MEDLTPEQEAKLLGLRPRDKFRQDDKYQRKLLAALINEPKLSDLIPMIQPYFFAHEAHHDAFKYIKEYYTANREVPTIYMIQEHFKKIHAERDVAIRLHFGAEIHGISTYYTPGLVEINYLRCETITNAGLFDASSTGNLYIKGDFSGVVLSAGDKIQFQMTVQEQ